MNVNMNTPVTIPEAQLARIGLTSDEVAGFPMTNKHTDVLGHGIAELARKSIVGVDGTNIQMVEAIGNDDDLYTGQAALYLAKNHLNPTAGDVAMLAPLAEETARRLLSLGDSHTVNRRAELKNTGILTDDDVVPANIRLQWIG